MCCTINMKLLHSTLSEIVFSCFCVSGHLVIIYSRTFASNSKTHPIRKRVETSTINGMSKIRVRPIISGDQFRESLDIFRVCALVVQSLFRAYCWKCVDVMFVCVCVCPLWLFFTSSRSECVCCSMCCVNKQRI